MTLKQELSAKGLAFNQPAHAGFRQALSQAGFYETWKKKFGDEAWATLEGAVGKLA